MLPSHFTSCLIGFPVVQNLCLTRIPIWPTHLAVQSENADHTQIPFSVVAAAVVESENQSRILKMHYLESFGKKSSYKCHTKNTDIYKKKL